MACEQKHHSVENVTKAARIKGQLISEWFFGGRQFPPKNEQKQIDLRYHGSKVEFVRLFFGGN